MILTFWPQYHRWQAVTAIDVVTDVAICFLPLILTLPLNMPITWKAQVGLAFGFRIIIVPVSILRLAYFRGYPTSDEPQFAATTFLIIQQVMLALSLMSATVPNMKSFMNSFYWGLGFAGLEAATAGTSSSAYELETIGSTPMRKTPKALFARKSTERDTTEYESSSMLRPDQTHHQVRIFSTHADDNSVATSDGTSLHRIGSRDLMIKEEMNYDVERD